MRSFLRKKLAGLAGCTSGNAAVLVSLGMPILIGGAGLGVDTAQWYLWKRELQNAVDQAAIAGAWEKAKNQNGDSFINRATQEYNASVKLTAAFDSGPTVTLENYDGGTANSVQVTAWAQSQLPFSSILTGRATKVSVRAVAIHEPGTTYKPCFLALHPNMANALFLNGQVTVNAACGLGALSTNASAISTAGGSGDVKVGFVVTGGGINDQQGHFKEETRLQWATNLENPYVGLTPPNNPNEKSLPACGNENGKYTAYESVSIKTTYRYFKGPRKNELTAYTNPEAKPTTTSTPVVTAGKEFSQEPEGYSDEGKADLYEIPGGGNDKIWEEKTETTIVTYNITASPNTGPVSADPGTYVNFDVQCDTVLNPGVYVLNGTTLKIAADSKLSGDGVMFVLKGGSDIQVSGSAEIDLTAMTRDELLAVQVSQDQVDRMLGMLIFEDKDSHASSDSQLTGNSTQILNGIVYMPNSGLKIAGTPQGNSQCLVLATESLQIAGGTNITSMCPANMAPNATVSQTKDVVRLVA